MGRNNGNPGPWGGVREQKYLYYQILERRYKFSAKMSENALDQKVYYSPELKVYSPMQGPVEFDAPGP